MHDYQSIKRLHGSRVSQTIDSPIMILTSGSYRRRSPPLRRSFVRGGFLLVGNDVLLLMLVLFAMPVIRSKNNRGFSFTGHTGTWAWSARSY